MNKQKAAKICGIISAVLVLLFIINTVLDYFTYSSTLNSAPFYIWVLVNAATYVFPAIILFTIFIYLKRR